MSQQEMFICCKCVNSPKACEEMSHELENETLTFGALPHGDKLSLSQNVN